MNRYYFMPLVTALVAGTPLGGMSLPAHADDRKLAYTDLVRAMQSAKIGRAHV